jgi:hypothetical protein
MQFEVCDTLFASAHIQNVDRVCVWLGVSFFCHRQLFFVFFVCLRLPVHFVIVGQCHAGVWT